ncbi:retropepsin-like aspartic protease [Oceaniserpentilla sp. 4NH20-0058]|uniref:retropepsin-like aspartic protease family protein n=1 Tax=Oceaniserpentilla sp. 4NH20-0058 TaxID=3127660 RepID=UPI003341C629
MTTVVLIMLSMMVKANIQAVGLMPGMAILEKDGQRLIIKAGEEKEGITLIRADSQQCLVEINGQRQTLMLGASLASGYTVTQGKEVRLQQDYRGHYFTNVNVNGKPVKMLVDTGATTVAMSGQTARRLGIAYANGRKGRSATAGGIVNNFMIRVNELNMQGIKRYNVPVSVIEGAHPDIPLLGMSFLGQLKIQQDNGELVISE